jgi:hypothetical protein
MASGAFTIIPERVMLRIPNDDYVHVSYRIAELKHNPPTTPVVYLFGGSGTKEMIRSESGLARAISAEGGASVGVVSLATHAESMGETLALVDNLPRGRGLLAIGLSPNRLITAPADDASQLSGSPLAVTSPHLAAVLSGRTSLARRLPGQVAGALDFALSYLGTRFFTRTPHLRPITYEDHYYTDGPLASPSAKKRGSAVELARERPLYAANVSYNLSVLAETIRLGREKGYDVACFEQPLGPEVRRRAWDSYLATYHADVAGILLELKVPDVDVEPSAGLRAGDFADLFHLVDSGRDKWTPPFAHEVARILKRGREIARP